MSAQKTLTPAQNAKIEQEEILKAQYVQDLLKQKGINIEYFPPSQIKERPNFNQRNPTYGVTIDQNFLINIAKNEYLSSQQIQYYCNMFRQIYSGVKVGVAQCHFFSDFMPHSTEKLHDSILDPALFGKDTQKSGQQNDRKVEKQDITQSTQESQIRQQNTPAPKFTQDLTETVIKNEGKPAQQPQTQEVKQGLTQPSKIQVTQEQKSTNGTRPQQQHQQQQQQNQTQSSSQKQHAGVTGKTEKQLYQTADQKAQVKNEVITKSPQSNQKVEQQSSQQKTPQQSNTQQPQQNQPQKSAIQQQQTQTQQQQQQIQEKGEQQQITSTNQSLQNLSIQQEQIQNQQAAQQIQQTPQVQEPAQQQPEKKWTFQITNVVVTKTAPPSTKEAFNIGRLDQLLSDLALQNGLENKQQLSKCDYLFFPINQNNYHWVSLIINFNKKIIHYFDSYYNTMNKDLVVSVDALLKSLNQDPKGYKTELHLNKQGNGFDCGIFVLLSLLYTFKRLDYTYDQTIVSEFRRRRLHNLAVIGSQIQIDKQLFDSLIDEK